MQPPPPQKVLRLKLIETRYSTPHVDIYCPFIRPRGDCPLCSRPPPRRLNVIPGLRAQTDVRQRFSPVFCPCEFCTHRSFRRPTEKTAHVYPAKRTIDTCNYCIVRFTCCAILVDSILHGTARAPLVADTTVYNYIRPRNPFSRRRYRVYLSRKNRRRAPNRLRKEDTIFSSGEGPGPTFSCWISNSDTPRNRRIINIINKTFYFSRSRPNCVGNVAIFFFY